MKNKKQSILGKIFQGVVYLFALCFLAVLFDDEPKTSGVVKCENMLYDVILERDDLKTKVSKYEKLFWQLPYEVKARINQ